MFLGIWCVNLDFPRLHQLSIHYIQRFNRNKPGVAFWLFRFNEIKKPGVSQFCYFCTLFNKAMPHIKKSIFVKFSKYHINKF